MGTIRHAGQKPSGGRLAAAIALSVMLAFAAALSRPAPAQATIHEIVASACSGNAVQDPPGQSDPTKKSFLRALVATGVLLGFEPDAELGGVKVLFDFDHPATKLAWDGESWVGPFGSLFFPDAVLDHPSFPNCPKLSP